MTVVAPASPRVSGDEPGLAGLEARGAVRRGSWRLLWLLVALALLVVVILVSIAVGSRQIPLGTVVDALVDPSDADDEHIVIRSLRVPRTVAGLLVGVALGLAGAVMQGVTRNPLADPGLLGVSAGASFAVVFGISVVGVGSALDGYVWFAFAGAAAASVVVYALGAIGRGGATPVKLALAGAAVSSFLLSMTTAMLLMDQSTLDEYRFWAVGSVAGRDPDLITQLAPFIVVGTAMALVAGPVLNSLALGDDVARSLGSRVGLARAFAAVSVVLLVGAATALAGPIAFVGLTIPHVARAITGPDYRWVLAYSMVLAPILLLVSDVIGRIVARPGELQVGIVTAIIGAPFFVLLVRRRRLAELSLAEPRPDQAPSDVHVIRLARITGRARSLTVAVVLAVVGFVLFCLSVSIGDFKVPLTDVVPAIFGAGDPAVRFIVGELRLPRAVAGALVGAAFGLAGAMFQTLARNPLASPDFIGITSGASLAAVFGIVVLHASGNAIVAASFLGALASAAAIYLLAWKRGLSSYRLVLVGIGVAAAVDAGTAYLLTKARIYDVQSAVVWLTGSLNGRTWSDVKPLALGMLVLVPATLALASALRLLMLGDDTAAGLGLRVERSRLLIVLVAVTLTALATSAAGPIEFVALLAAPIARRLVGSPLALVPSALVGAVLVLAADVAARQALPTTNLPVGVVTGIIGAPYLLWLLARSNRVGSGG